MVNRSGGGATPPSVMVLFTLEIFSAPSGSVPHCNNINVYDDFDDDEVVNDADDNRSERFLQQSSHSDQGGNWSRLLVIIGRMN